jgi:hypothetical protein
VWQKSCVNGSSQSHTQVIKLAFGLILPMLPLKSMITSCRGKFFCFLLVLNVCCCLFFSTFQSQYRSCTDCQGVNQYLCLHFCKELLLLLLLHLYMPKHIAIALSPVEQHGLKLIYIERGSPDSESNTTNWDNLTVHRSRGTFVPSYHVLQYLPFN